MITWKRYKDSEPLAQIVAPGSNGQNTKISESIKKFLSEGFDNDHDRAQYKGYTKKILTHVVPNKGINTFTMKDVKELKKKLLKSGHAEQTAERVKATLAAVIRYEKTGQREKRGERLSAASNGDEPVRLKIGAARLEDLIAVIGISSTGRFAAIKVDVKKAIESCGKDEFRIIYLSKEMKENKKEREAARGNIQAMLNKYHKEWIIRYAPAEGVFVLVKKSDFKNAVGGVK